MTHNYVIIHKLNAQKMEVAMETKKILWYNLAFMAFSTVWGFGNVV